MKERLKQRRKECNLTLEELATACDSAKSYIWELENTEDKNPSGMLLYKIAKALNVTIEYLLTGSGNEEFEGCSQEIEALIRFNRGRKLISIGDIIEFSKTYQKIRHLGFNQQ